MSYTGAVNYRRAVVELKKETTLTAKRFKIREIIVRPTLLSYRKPVSASESLAEFQIFVDPNGDIDVKHDFLLAPIGKYIDIVQVLDNLLVLSLKHKKIKGKYSDELIQTEKPMICRQLTLKFKTREERNCWMEYIVAECDKIYLRNFLDEDCHLSEDFSEETNSEIWSRVILGDETLRKAYIAPIGSDHFEWVKIVVSAVVRWLQDLLNERELRKNHAEVFAALLSLMVRDTAARVFFLLIRPSSEAFLEDYRSDTAVLGPNEGWKVALRFVETVRTGMMAADWKPFRSFLHVLNHPSYNELGPCCDSDVSDRVKKELVWMRGFADTSSCEFSWLMCTHALKAKPYFSYYFIIREIHELIDDHRVGRVLALLDRVPEQQKEMEFNFEGVAKSLRKHLKALIDYCKFREVWKIFHVDHTGASDFFDSVHSEIWRRIATDFDPEGRQLLTELFLPTNAAAVESTFAAQLGRHLAINADQKLLRQLNVVPIVSPEAEVVEVNIEATRAVEAIRSLAIGRILHWTRIITGNNELIAEDALIFVNLLVAATKSAVFRAVLWLFSPSADAVRVSIEDTNNAITNPLSFCNFFIAAVSKYSDSSVPTVCFLSFLAAADHPLAEALRDSVSAEVFISTVTKLLWSEEMAWMSKFPRQQWVLSWSELTLALHNPPYLTLQILLRRRRVSGDSYESHVECLDRIALMNKSVVQCSFKADVNMFHMNSDGLFRSGEVKEDLHFLSYIESLRVIEVWKTFQTPLLKSNAEFLECVQNRLLSMLALQRNSSAGTVVSSGFAALFNARALIIAGSSDVAKFSTVIPQFLCGKVASGDKMWCSLLSFLSSVSGRERRDREEDDIMNVKSFSERLAVWCRRFYCAHELTGPVGEGFAELLNGSLSSVALRAVCSIVEPLVSSDQEANIGMILTLIEDVKNANQSEFFPLLLQTLKHPGVYQEDNGSFLLNEPSWENEWQWMSTMKNEVALQFDHVAFSLLADPAYLLFRQICRNFQFIGRESTHTIVYELLSMPASVLDRVFKAQLNYLPCASFVHENVQSLAISEAPHFRHLMQYCLFHEMWQITLSKMIDLDPDSFILHTIVFYLWQRLTGGAHSELNSELNRLFLPPAEINLNMSGTTYACTMQRHALLTISAADSTFLRLFYPQIDDLFRGGAALASDCELAAHYSLLDCVWNWTICLSGDVVGFTEPAAAAIFVALLAEIAEDVAMRVFIVTFAPAKSMISDFMASNKYQIEADSSETVADAGVQVIKLLSQTFRRKSWLEYRSFIALLLELNFREIDFAAVGRNETDLSWALEAEWISTQNMMKPKLLSWQELMFVMTDTPYILLLVIIMVVPELDQLRVMKQIPRKYLLAKFGAYSRDAPHFVAMCLTNATRDNAVEVFQNRLLVNDEFFKLLLHESASNSACPRILQAFHLLQKLFYHDATGVWNIDALRSAPEISSILIIFLHGIGQRTMFVRDEKVLCNMVLLVLHLEGCRSNGDVEKVTTLASDWMCQSRDNATMFFGMLQSLGFVRWFANLCWRHINVFGYEPRMNIHPDIGSIYSYDSESSATGGDNVMTSARNMDDPVLDGTVPLTKSKLWLCVVGFFSLCIEFDPSYLTAFLDGLSPTGRPFFAHFLHADEALSKKAFDVFRGALKIEERSYLNDKFCNGFVFYDNDHVAEPVVRTIGLHHHSSGSVCLSLNDNEFTDLLTVAVYLHELQEIDTRFESAVVSIIADQNHREMLFKFTTWVVNFFITPDIEQENAISSSKAKRRVLWRHCEKFTAVSFEDILECAAEATLATHLLRSGARSSSYDTLERLFLHYLQNSPPCLWLSLFRGSKTIAYFIKYVDAEDVNLAFAKFYDMNKGNYLFLHNLLKVRKLFQEPIVHAKELVKLTSSRSSFNEDNATAFFKQLESKGSKFPAEHDLKIVYFLTASWMKISKEKVLFPLPPRNAQIITMLTVATWAKNVLRKIGDKTMGKALIAQVGTGEGKSLIIAMMAIYFVKVLGKRVHILENNPGLLAKDVETMTPLFAEFNIKRRNPGAASRKQPDLTFTTTEKLMSTDCRSEFCDFGVTYCLRKNMERYYQDCVMNGIFQPLARTVLIVDEVDDLIVDDAPNHPYASLDSDQPHFQNACEWFKERSDLPSEKEGNFAWETAEIARIGANAMVDGVHYTIKEGRYVLLEEGRAVTTYDTRLEFLNFVQLGIAPVLKSTYYYQSIPYILSKYDCITGFSGSLGSPSEREFLREQHKAWCFDTPSFLNTCIDVRKVEPKLMDDSRCPNIPCVHVFNSVELQVKKIVEMCSKLRFEVPVLVIAKSTDEAVKIEAELRRQLQPDDLTDDGSNYIQLFLECKVGTMTLDKDRWGHIVRRATSKKKEENRYCITVTDPFGGRGHDFDVHDDDVNRAGGLAVIMTSIPASDREWRQWKGRTARKDNNGQYAVVLCAKDQPISIAPEILRDFGILDSKRHVIPNLYSEALLDKLIALQDKNQDAKLIRLKGEIQMGRRLNRLCDLFYEAYGSMNEHTWPANGQEVLLRNLLMEPNILPREIDKAFLDLNLEEKEDHADEIQSPNTSSTAFWDDEDAADWENVKYIALDTKVDSYYGENKRAISGPSASAETTLMHNNPLKRIPKSGTTVNPRSRATSTSTTTDTATAYQKHAKLDTGHVKSIKALLPISQPGRVRATIDKFQSVSNNSGQKALWTEVADYLRPDPFMINLHSAPPSSVRSLRPPSPPPRPVDLSENFAIDMTALPMTRQRVPSTMAIREKSPPPAPPRDEEALTAVCVEFCAAEFERTEEKSASAAENKQAKRATRPKPVETVFDIIAARSIVTPPSQTLAVQSSGREERNNISQGHVDTSKVVNSSAGVTVTSEKSLIRLIGAANHLTEIQQLTELRIGEMTKVSNSLTKEMKNLLSDVQKAALTVGVYDIIAESSCGNGVCGLEVSCALERRKFMYYLIFIAKAVPETAQYNLAMYGDKRFEAKFNNVLVLGGTVKIKPALSVRPSRSLVCHSALDASRITKNGKISVHSISGRDTAPVINTLQYSGEPATLTSTLRDAVITVTLDIPGFSKKSETFVLFNGEFSPSVAQVNLSPANLVGGEWRVVLTWGDTPRDLDLYCITNFMPQKIYYGAKNKGGRAIASMGKIELDVDVMQGKGPETITFTPDATKKYRFFVHNYSGCNGEPPSIVASGAKIVVYKGNHDSEQFDIEPDIVIDSQTNRHAVIWHVFDLFVGVMKPVNEVVKDGRDLRNVAL